MKLQMTALALGACLLAPGAHAGKFSDFDNDGRSDVFWRNGATGVNYVFPMSGTTILGTEGYARAVADQSWQVAAIGDFNGDGNADLLWRHAGTGQNYVYLMSGKAISGEGYLRTVADQNWQVAGVGDFNGDDRADILWRHGASGQNYIYLMDGLSILPAEGFTRTVADGNWQVAGIADFDQDGKDDVLWRNGATGDNYLYLMNGLAIKAGEGFVRAVRDQNWQVAGVGDFHGDGKNDILWRNAATGENYIYPMNGRSVESHEGYIRAVPDPNWQVAAVGDYDGDDASDIFWRNAATGQNYLFPMSASGIKPSEGYVRTVADLAWSAVGPSSPVTAAVAGVRRLMSQIAQTINTQGEALARSHVLGYYDGDFLNGGYDRIADSGFLVNDLRGLAVQSWIPAGVLRYDAASQTLFTRDLLTMADGEETFAEGFENSFRRQADGTWKFSGDRRVASMEVNVQMATVNFGIPDGPSQKAYVSGSAPEGTVAGMTVTGAGVFDDTVVTKSSSTVLELVQADPEPAEREPVYKDSFFTSAATALSSPGSFTFNVTPASGPMQSYSIRSNAVTDQYVTMTAPAGHALAQANLGGSVEAQWAMSSPGFEIASIQVSGYVRTAPFPAAAAQCHIVGQDLPPSTTSATLSLPAMCEGQPVQQAVIDVIVEGVNGERTAYTHGFQN